MAYTILRTSRPVDWDTVEPLFVREYPWGGDYRPEVMAQIVFVPDEGFCIRMTCREENPRATYTAPNSPVCRDSCMEFFAAFDPERPDVYINFECNANGCLLSEFGTNTSRTFIDRLGCTMPVPSVWKKDGCWGWELLVPLSLLHHLFGERAYEPGFVLRANVFKCGDDTEQPHYGSWQPIDWPEPSFHRPQFFGQMILA